MDTINNRLIFTMRLFRMLLMTFLPHLWRLSALSTERKQYPTMTVLQCVILHCYTKFCTTCFGILYINNSLFVVDVSGVVSVGSCVMCCHLQSKKILMASQYRLTGKLTIIVWHSRLYIGYLKLITVSDVDYVRIKHFIEHVTLNINHFSFFLVSS